MQNGLKRMRQRFNATDSPLATHTCAYNALALAYAITSTLFIFTRVCARFPFLTTKIRQKVKC